MDELRDSFTVVKAASDGIPRLARFVLPGRAPIDTPHYLANTSRGVVPHLTQDTLSRSTSVAGTYVSLEDFIEKSPPKTPPIYEYSTTAPDQPLRRFLALPEDKILVLGARRTPPVVPAAATSNTDSSVAISTSVGFRFLKVDEYARQSESLGADVVIGLADVPHGRATAAKRIEKATDRSIDWVSDHLKQRRRDGAQSKYFAALLPVTCANQQFYVDSLVEDHLKDIHGLAIYNLDTLEDLPDEFFELPRIGYTEVATPLQALQHIQRGIDMLVMPFVDIATDAGSALTFVFDGSDASGEPLPLGEDMWDVLHATDLSPLSTGCSCYACSRHHRAYVRHLLSAKEMLGWVLLQIHNQQTIYSFFAAIRSSVADGTFLAKLDAFIKRYEPDLPAKTGQGPRVRGYQRRTEHDSEPKLNARAYRQLNGQKVVHQRVPRPDSITATGLPDDFDLGLLRDSFE